MNMKEVDGTAEWGSGPSASGEGRFSEIPG